MKCHFNDGRRRQQRRIVFGLFFIVAGVLALLGNLHLIEIGDIGHYWPTVFCVFGALHVVQARRLSGAAFGIALIVLGAGLTLQNLGIVHHVMPLILPVFLILAGLSVVARAFRPHGLTVGGSEPAVSQIGQQDGVVHMNVTMSGAPLRCDSQDFKGGELRAIMGGIELDLRQASMASQAVLRISAVCSGIQIRIPQDWSLQVRIAPVLGGIEDKTIPPAVASKTLILEGEMIMGGIQVQN
ncbi:LiaF transmembrane domain-containing protein [Paludibacterium purpuratum]|uniref:LiaF transmembrane domain-containing protein n=1 Tax=Paludibacterium purpuratum TaxID=1144873 RepID=A0A4V3DVM7_9NEIS|nr:DUF5668 domain-containing protein [Paludibacterium purpuratum]TDR81519.1 hypothetical protein DFP86_103172 [Paludibacterium purpuratum]